MLHQNVPFHPQTQNLLQLDKHYSRVSIRTHEVMMTNERGVKEKVIAAHRAGIRTIILPQSNKKDVIKIPKDVKLDVDFKFVSHMDEVLKIALKN